MELTWIEDFLALADSGNFSDAADRRASTQPAFSRRIKQLEEWLGDQLLDRSTRPIILTPAGRRFLPRAQHIRDEIIDARRASLVSRSNLVAAKRIYVTPSLVASNLPALLLRQAINNAAIMVASTFGCIDAVKKGLADHALIAVDRNDRNHRGLDCKIVKRERLLLTATKTIAPTVMIKDRKLHGSFLAYAPSTVYALQINELLMTAKITFAQTPVIESASTEALLAFVKADYGAAWLPENLLDEHLIPIKIPALQKLTQTIVWLSQPNPGA